MLHLRDLCEKAANPRVPEDFVSVDGGTSIKRWHVPPDGDEGLVSVKSLQVGRRVRHSRCNDEVGLLRVGSATRSVDR